MKKRRRNFLQKMTSVLLSAVLIIGMSVGAVPAEVLAAENTEIVESVSENTTEIMEEETTTEPVEENKSEEEIVPEDAGEPEEEIGIEDTGETKEETGLESADEPVTEETAMPDVETDVMLTVTQEDSNIASGTDGTAPLLDIAASGEGWTLDVNGVLTIKSNAGLSNWIVWSGTTDTNFNQQYSKGGKKLFIKKVVIETGVTDIVDKAFSGCNNLTEVHIPDTVTNIGAQAFRSCALTAVDLPDNLQTIGSLAFGFCKFSKVIIPEKVKVIPDQCFYNCPLTSITIPAGITEIQFSAFNGCKQLTEVKVEGNTPPVIGERIFANCDFVTNDTQVIEVPEGYAATYKMAWPAWASYIKPDTNLNYPVAYGEGWSLDGNGVLKIESDTGMSNWKVWSDTFDYNFNKQYSKGGKKLFIKKVVIETGVTGIVDEAFNSCNNLAVVHIPDTVTSIGNEAFRSCFELTAVDLPDNLQTIGVRAFANCKLTMVIIPEKIKVIPEECFFKCPLTGITIPAGITKIQSNAFDQCTLTEVKVKGTTPPVIGSDIFNLCSFVTSNVKGIKVPAGCVDTYKNAWQAWKDYIQPDTHTHNLTFVPAKASTCIEKGNSAYYICSGCDKWFADDEGTTEIADKSSVEIALSGHTFGAWTVIKPATASEEGINERSCTVCGYKQTETISETGGDSPDEGDIEVDKVQGDNTPDAGFKTSKDDLINAVLTPEEQSLVEEGTDIRITLVIDDIDASVSQSDKQTVTDKAGEYKVGQYLDINLYKIIGTDRTKVSHTNGKIKIALTIPDSLKNTDSGKTRSYAVVRVHDGVAELLPDTDNDSATITFETDLFSTYALVYKDTVNTGNNDKNNNGSSGKDSEPKTGETTPVEICATIAMIAGFSYLLDLFGNIKGGMTEQEKKEIVASIIAWGRKGGKLRRLAALALIFAILVYYHSIGRQVDVDWKEAYGE